MRIDLRKRLLEVFGKPQSVEEEMKTSILDSNMYIHIVMAYDIYSMSERSRRLNEAFIKALLMASRGIGGKGSEQMINVLSPRHFQQYLFPMPSLGTQPQQQEEEKKEEKKRGWKLI